MGQGHPKGNKWDAGARKPCSKKPNDHTKSLREERKCKTQKKPSRLGSNNITTGIVE